jgi:Na+/phosphate symporter
MIKIVLAVLVLHMPIAAESFVKKTEKKVSVSKLKENITQQCATILPQTAEVIQKLADIQKTLLKRLEELLMNISSGCWCSATQEELENITQSLHALEVALKDCTASLDICSKSVCSSGSTGN